MKKFTLTMGEEWTARAFTSCVLGGKVLEFVR